MRNCPLFNIDRQFAFGRLLTSDNFFADNSSQIFKEEKTRKRLFIPTKTKTTETESLQGEQALRFMRSHLRNTPTIAKPRVHLEVVHTLPGKKQNGKFWIGEASPVGLTLKWGKPDTVGQQHFIPAENCEGNNSVMELEARAEKKIKEGYSLNTTKSSF